MSRPDLDPLDADLDALLDAERERPSFPPEMRARVRLRVGATIDPGGGSAPPAAPPPAVPPAAALGGPLAKAILIGAALGGLVSAVIVARPDPATPPPAAVMASAAPASRAVPSAAPSTEPIAAPAPDHADGLPSSPSARASASEPGHDTSLAAERYLLDEAQRALAGGQSAAALDALARHERTFPRGRLAEEREAISIRALARAGHVDEARARADQFRAAHPNSILLPAIDAAVGTIP